MVLRNSSIFAKERRYLKDWGTAQRRKPLHDDIQELLHEQSERLSAADADWKTHKISMEEFFEIKGREGLLHRALILYSKVIAAVDKEAEA